jgi:hypothetical protein
LGLIIILLHTPALPPSKAGKIASYQKKSKKKLVFLKTTNFFAVG